MKVRDSYFSKIWRNRSRKCLNVALYLHPSKKYEACVWSKLCKIKETAEKYVVTEISNKGGINSQESPQKHSWQHAMQAYKDVSCCTLCSVLCARAHNQFDLNTSLGTLDLPVVGGQFEDGGRTGSPTWEKSSAGWTIRD